MPSRFDWERALRDSDLSAPQRHTALTIATYADVRTGIVPEKYTPSVRKLAAATGLNQSTISRALVVLVDKGWLGRRSPSPKDARTKHARNSYWLTLPPGASGAVCTEHTAPDPVCTEHTACVQEAHSLDAQGTQPVRTEPTNKSLSVDQSKSARAAVISELAAATGRTVDDEWATKVAKQLLGAAPGDVASPVAYVVRSIRAAADDGTVNRFLPTPGPDRFAPAEDLEEVLPPRPDPVMETAACGHLRVAGDDEECWLCAQEAADAAAGDAPQQPAAADSDCAADPGPGPDRPTLTVHPGGNRPPRRGRDQPPLLTAVDGTPDTPTTPAPGLPPELAARLARHRAGFAGRTRGATA